MTPPTAGVDALARLFTYFADHECGDDPLYVALCRLIAARPALLDFGCSAGLNLAVDHYRYDYGVFTLGASGVPTIGCRLVGASAARLRDSDLTAPRLMQRTGIDPAAVDVFDATQLRWLRACIWPYDRERATRFDQALAIAQREHFTVRRVDDCAAAIEPWLDSVPVGVLPVVFNSWVLHYFDKAARAAHVAFMRELVQRRGIVWLSAEGAHIPMADAAFEPVGDAQVSDDALAKGSLWWLIAPGDGGPTLTLLARSHPHGRWLQWL